MTPKPQPAKYPDYYGMLSHKDFLAAEAAGTLDSYQISTRTDMETK